MRILVDESVERRLVSLLRSDGHQVVAVFENCPSTADIDVIALSVREESILLTQDKDFGQLVFERGSRAVAVVLVRLADLSFDRKSAIVRQLLQTPLPDLTSRFWVIDPAGIRSRALPRH